MEYFLEEFLFPPRKPRVDRLDLFGWKSTRECMEKRTLIRYFQRISDESLGEHDISTYRLESLTENEEI